MSFPKPVLFSSLLFILSLLGIAIWWSATQNDLGEIAFERSTRTLAATPTHFELDTSAEVEFRLADTNEVTLTGDEDILETLDVREEDETLRIGAAPNALEVLTWERSDLIIVVETVEPLTSVRLNGDVLVSGQGVAGEEARIISGGQLDGELLGNETEELNVDLTGTGNLELTGSARRSMYTSRGAANIDARNLSSERTVAEVIGQGVVRTQTKEQLQARVEGEGAILYTQTPAQLQSQINGSGVVELSD